MARLSPSPGTSGAGSGAAARGAFATNVCEGIQNGRPIGAPGRFCIPS